MSKTGKIVYLCIAAIFFILLNIYLTETIIDNGYKLVENPVFSVTHIHNQGAAFNIFEGYRAFLISFSALAIVGIIFYTVKHIKIATVMSLFFVALLISGIFNNMLERIIFGYVRDFIKLNFIDFPVFNLSDMFINISVIAIVIIILKNNYIKKWL